MEVGKSAEQHDERKECEKRIKEQIVKMEKVESNHDFRKRRIEEASDTKVSDEISGLQFQNKTVETKQEKNEMTTEAQPKAITEIRNATELIRMKAAIKEKKKSKKSKRKETELMPKIKIIPCRDEIDEQPEVKELKAVIFKGRVEAAAFTAIPYEKVVDRAAEEVTIQDKKKKKKKSKTKSKFKISTKDSKKAMEKEDSSPLKAETKAELEIKKLKNDGMDKEMETEEIKLVVEEKIDEEDGKDEGDAEINDEKKKNSKENAKSKKSKNKSKKTDFIPLKVEVKSEPEMKEIMHNNKNEGMETKEEAPEAQEKVTEKVNKAAEEVEIKGEKKKNNSNKKSNSKNGEKKEIAVTPQIRKIPSKDIAEMQPVKNEVNADIVKRGIESAKCAAILAEKSFEKVGKYVKALENVDMKNMKNTSMKSTKSGKYSEEIIPKEDLNPLNKEIKSKTEIKKSTHAVEEKEIETKELTPVVEERIPEEVDEAEEEVEIKDEERIKKEAKEKSDDIRETTDDMNDEEIETEELTPIVEERIPEEVDEAEEEVEIKDEERMKKEAKEKSDDIRETTDDMNDEDIETKELTPVVEERIPEEVDEAKEEVEIKNEKKKKKKSKKKSGYIREIPDDMNDEKIETEELTPIVEERIPEEVDEAEEEGNNG
ncbi:hypothetical protein T06_8597 [Trichinella sp. T6]|nr:hypothetical protein T06_8597 [Trichinella sp. T6]